METVRKVEPPVGENTRNSSSRVIPFLMVEGADRVLEFMKTALGAEEIFLMRHSTGTIWHAQVRVGDSLIMLADSMGKKEHAMPAMLYVYVDDADAYYRKAIAAGAVSVMEPADQFWGDRSGGVRDSGGNVWWLATRIEDLSPEEMTRRGRDYEKQHAVR
ncbi:MAG: VOC family protein [Pseudomonadota bacterium]|nr:VOC family protein [Pseudomonadota bacterium]